MTAATRERALPVILACAVVQGSALFGLHHAVDSESWPATNAALLLALYAVVVFVPLTIQMLARHIHSPLLWGFLAVLAAAFFGFGLHEGANVHHEAARRGSTARLTPLLFVLFLVWAQVLPFIQGRLATGQWRYGYPVLFTKAWRNALVLAEATLFTGFFWLLLYLWQELFALLGIGFFKELFEEPVFAYPVTALAFGSALHLIGSVERLTLAILEQLLNVLKWLGVLGSFILVIFSIALAMKLPGLLATGERAISAVWLLWLIAVVVLLLNAAYRDGQDPRPYPAWLGRALRGAVPLTLVVSLVAVYALAVRAGQYGLTVERVWGFVVAASAVLYSAGYSWASLRGGPWMRDMGRVNVLVSMVLVCVLALTLTPVLSPTRLAADSQFRAALTPEGSSVDGRPGHPPISWLRFQGGGYGRERLEELAELEGHPQADGIRRRARAALAAEHVKGLVVAEWEAALDTVVVHPAGRSMPAGIRAAIEADLDAGRFRPGTATWKPGTGAGVYLDLNEDGREEFLLLFPGGGQLYARTDREWRYAGWLREAAGSGDWDDTLAKIGAGGVARSEPSWRDVVVGELRLQVIEGE